MSTLRNPNENLQRIADILERLERKINPPLYQKAIKFAFGHLILITTLLGLLYFTWQIWGTIGNLLSIVQMIFNKIGNFSGGLGGALDNVKQLWLK